MSEKIKTYKELEYIVFPHLGSYCGYVKLPPGHPFENLFRVKRIPLDGSKSREIWIGYDEMNIDCHGGLTFSRKVSKENKRQYQQNFSPGFWIGWDYFHSGDACGLIGFEGDKIWTLDEVEKECKYVIDQVLKKYEQVPV